MHNSNFDNQLKQKAKLVNNTLHEILAAEQIAGNLGQAVTYTLQAPGKRIRAALLLWSCELIAKKTNKNAEFAAAAIEMVHTYSLVHDDLPAMDNDDLRRGQPAAHKAFTEATAILAGDALLTLAFEILAKNIDNPTTAVALIQQLAHDAGPAGMIAGQMADLDAENGDFGPETLDYIHINKTAKMFRCATAMGAICGGANESQLFALCEYGLKIGLGFQVADDILDVSASSEHLGKTAGKDANAAKCTYPAVHGMDKSKQLAERLANEAVNTLEPFGPDADILRALVFALLERTR